MSQAHEGLQGLQAALAAARAMIAGIGEGQWALPTPCPEWTVDELTTHVILGNRMFAAAVQGGQAAEFTDQVGVGTIDGDRVAAYDEAAEHLVTAFGEDGALDRVVTVPFGTVPGAVALHLCITELLAHGWDLARATGQRFEAPAGVAERELAFTRQALGQVPPGRSPFGPPQPVPADAPPLDQLAGLLGRAV
jgi:uncharacterized protein (TIGR03086 family)